MILEYRTTAWWYWLTTLMCLGAALAGWEPGLRLAMLATVLHGLHFAATGHALTSFPVQVRISYLLLLVVGAWPPLELIHWALLVGTSARVLFAYCFLARTLSLASWNRKAPFSMDLVQRVYLTPPTRGSILDAMGKV